MSKIFVIKDEEELRAKLNVATLVRSVCIVSDVMDVLKDYEREVIGFEAEVSGIHYSIRTAKTLTQRIDLETYPEIKDIKSGDKFHVFVVKPKKPEVKDEAQA